MPSGSGRTLALVLMKPVTAAKRRLASSMSPGQRRRLSELMLELVLRAVSKSGVEGRALVTADDRMGPMAQRFGFTLLKEKRPRGFSRAVLLALQSPLARHYEDVLILPGDLPLLRAEEIDRALALRRSARAPVLSPSLRLDGTNLLLAAHDELPPLHYERDSFLGHMEELRRRGSRFIVYYDLRLALDIDTMGDLELARRLFPRSEFARRARLKAIA